MTIYLFHGDNLASSREDFHNQLAREKEANKSISTLDGSTLIRSELESALYTQNLFQQETILLENIFTRVKSKAKDACLALLSEYQGDKTILIWEKKAVGKRDLNKFPKIISKLHKTPTSIFRLLDTISPDNIPTSLKLLAQASNEADEGFIFIMFARRVSDLLIAKSGDTSKLSPWLKSRLAKQAQAWSHDSLLSLHQQLAKFDLELKTGQTKLSYLDTIQINLAALAN